MATTFLFLYMNTGGGHLAPARAVASALEPRCGEQCRVILHDGLDGCNRFARFCIEDGYRILQSRIRWYYSVLYILNKFSPLAWLNLTLVSLFVKPALRSVIRKHNPDQIVVFHFFLIEPAANIVRRMKKNIPLTVVVTDPLTAHPMWFKEKGIRYIVFSERLMRYGIRLRIPPENIGLCSFPVSESFRQGTSSEERREALRTLRLRDDRKTILILGGGDGIPRGKRILKQVLRIKDHNIVMVCGKNRTLFSQAESEVRRSGRSDVLVFGYVDFVRRLLAAADVVISKCGASTFHEILQSGRIQVVTDYIWEQEKGNVEFLVDNGLGFFEPDLTKLEALIRRLLTDRELLSQTMANIAALPAPSGSIDVATHLLERGKAVSPDSSV
jgi:UDP-N-acetylglucosamine:LPS N-acetylglucosamine transferase